MHTIDPKQKKPNLLARLFGLLRWEPEFAGLFVRVIIPIALQNLVGASLHIVDGIMVSGLGTQAYAGVIQANRITFLVQLFLFGVVSGASIYFAQFWGKGDVKSMRRVQGLALRVSAGIALLFVTALVFFKRQILGLFLHEAESFAYGMQYLVIIMPGFLISAVDYVYAAMLRASGRTRIPMVSSIAAILCNTLFNYCLIHGKFGFPALGVRGAAIATVASAALSLAINLYASYRWQLAPGARLRDWRLPDADFCRRFFKTATPVVLNEGLWALGTTMYSVVYGYMGDNVVAAMGIAGTVDQLVFTLGFGIMSGAGVIVGNSIGAGREGEAYLYAKRVMLAGVLAMTVMGGVLLLVRGAIVNWFAFSAEARAMAMQVLFIAAFFLGARAFNAINVVGILRAGGDTVFSLTLDIGALWSIGVPLAFLTGLLLRQPIWVVYLAIQAEECIKVLIGLPRFISKKWIHNLVHESI